MPTGILRFFCKFAAIKYPSIMKKIVILFALTLVSFTANAQKPNGKTTQSSRPRTTQRSTQRKSSTTRQNTQNKAYSCPDNKHPHLIDLGLPSRTKWGCCNVGASKPVDYGGYYAWGEMEEKEEYTEENYHGGPGIDVAVNDSWKRHDEKNNSEYRRIMAAAEAKKQGKPEPPYNPDEVVVVNWQMPTSDQIKELVDNCKFQWTTINGVNGGKFTGPNGRSIFLPAAGRRIGGDLRYGGEFGNYWSSTPHRSNSTRAYYLGLSSSQAYWSEDPFGWRVIGHTVRPVSISK